MAETKTQSRKKATPAAKPEGAGRRFTPRKALSKKDEARLEDVTKAFEGDSATVINWAERYGRKALKHEKGLRATPAPIPPELGAEKAAKVLEILGIAAPSKDNGAAPIEGEPA